MFRKVLAYYYPIWFRDCYDSVIFCLKRGDLAKAEEYQMDFKKYFDIINENWDEIEPFLQGESGIRYEEHYKKFDAIYAKLNSEATA